MARNLGQTYCDFCNTKDIVLIEKPRPITKEDAGKYFESYEGMIIANAECSSCGTKYLAWIDERTITGSHKDYYNRYIRPRHIIDGELFFDLSFRSSFRDEAGDDDLPTRYYSIKEANIRIEQLEKYLRRWKSAAKMLYSNGKFVKRKNNEA